MGNPRYLGGSPIQRVINVPNLELETMLGNVYAAQYALTTAATSGHRTAIFLNSMRSSTLYMRVSFSASVAADYLICEAPTIAVNVGTHAHPVYNRLRDSLNISHINDNKTVATLGAVTTLTEAEIAADLTFAEGTVLFQAPINPATGLNYESENVIVLKENTNYIFMIKNTVATANKHVIKLDWLEN